MQLSGLIRTSCPPDRLAAMLKDPAVLARLMPAGFELQQTADGAFAFTVQRALGPIKINMPGTLTVAPAGLGYDCRLTAHAAHLIGGKVDVTLDIRLTAGATATVLNYEGELSASGLANRLLGERGPQAQNALRSLFMRLKRLAEADPALAAPKAALKQ